MADAKPINEQSLFNLTGEFLKLLENDYPEISEDDSEEVKAEKEKAQADFDKTLSQILTAMDDKMDGYCYVRARLLADIDTAKAEKKRIDDIIKRKERVIERMETSLFNSMVATGRTLIQTALHKITIKPKRATVRLLVDDPKDIPQEYQRIKTTVEADKTKIRDAIKNGERLDFAVYESQGDELKIS